MHNHWDFTTFEKHHAPNSPFVKLRKLCMSKRLNILTQIFEFAAYVESLGYVMVDFYDGSILYNFEQSKLTICDIDFFQKTPVFNEIGRIFGEQLALKHRRNMNCMHKLQAKRMCMC